jgi:hypothetical protein
LAYETDAAALTGTGTRGKARKARNGKARESAMRSSDEIDVTKIKKNG